MDVKWERRRETTDEQGKGSIYHLKLGTSTAQAVWSKKLEFQFWMFCVSMLIRQSSTTSLKIRAEVQAGHKMLEALTLECVKILTLI